MERKKNQNPWHLPGELSWGAKGLLLLLPLLMGLLALCLGRISIPPGEIASSLWHHLTGRGGTISSQGESVLWNIRLPRILLAMLAGAGLSVSGVTFQSVFANPLASPDTLGVAGGASLGAALGILLGWGLLGTQISALAFGLGAVGLTWLLSRGRKSNRTTVVLAGVLMGSLCSALLSLVKYIADPESQLPAITYWLMGSLASGGYKSLLLGAPLLLVGMGILLALRWRMNVLPLSSQEAATTGISVKKLRVLTILCATGVSAGCVAMCGQVGWVGLLVPHGCRMIFGNNHLSLVPASMSFGACFLVLVDTLARSISPGELPVSILTAIIGAPFFLVLIRRTGGWGL